MTLDDWDESPKLGAHVMDHIGSRESDLEFDLESGEAESSCEEDGSEESGSHGKHSRRLLSRGRSGYLCIEGSITANDGVGTSNKVLNIDENRNNLGSSVEKITEGGIEKRMEDTQKMEGSKKHPKPPRPPTGPSLHAADLELVKEISNRTRLRRARRERLKALNKMKTDRKSSSNINFLAIIVTAIFCFVIIFQGKCCLLVKTVLRSFDIFVTISYFLDIKMIHVLQLGLNC